MKPMEILSMIEEAAGTRMYESKKQAALKTIEKKESKVAEINRTMSEGNLLYLLNSFVFAHIQYLLNMLIQNDPA